jgi:hypothetical protein
MMAHDLDIDLEQAILHKMERNKENYFVDRSKEKSFTYNEF